MKQILFTISIAENYSPALRDYDNDGIANMYDYDDDNDNITDDYDSSQYDASSW